MFKVLALLLAILEATRPPVDSFLGNQVAGRTAHSVIQVPYVMKTSSFQSTVLMKTAGFHYRCVKQTNEPSKFSSLSPLCRLSSRWCCAHSFFFFFVAVVVVPRARISKRSVGAVSGLLKVVGGKAECWVAFPLPPTV